MNYAGMVECDCANGHGIRVSLFVSGCTNNCTACFNKDAQDFNYGTPFTDDTIDVLLCALSKPYIDGITILGGEPMEPRNQGELLRLLRIIRTELPEKSVWCYTGFTLEQLLDKKSYCHCSSTRELLSMIDVLVDGRYVESLKNITLKFRGSSNQRLIDLKRTLNDGVVTIYDC